VLARRPPVSSNAVEMVDAAGVIDDAYGTDAGDVPDPADDSDPANPAPASHDEAVS
jgi:hypothetical protein